MNTPIPIFFDQLLISMNFFQHVKNQAFSSFRSRDIIYLKILQSHWPKTFWQDSKRSQYFSKHTAININFHYKPNSEKKTKFSYIFKEPQVWPIFSIFGKNIFSTNPALSTPYNTILSSRKKWRANSKKIFGEKYRPYL